MSTINVEIKNKENVSRPKEAGHRIATCFFCRSEMEVVEGTVLYNSNWFHEDCWHKFENNNSNTNNDNLESSDSDNLNNTRFNDSYKTVAETNQTRNYSNHNDDFKGKVLIIGLGEIGYTNAEYMTKLGLWVEGYDISENATQRALRDHIIKREAQNFAGYDYYLICVSTHKPENQFIPYLDGLFEIVYRIAREGR